MKRSFRARFVALALALLAASFTVVLEAPLVGASGTEALGPINISVAEGTAFVTDGVGLRNGPGDLTIDVPAGDIVQVLARWSGEYRFPRDSDDTVVLDGIEVTGTQIGGPAEFWRWKGRNVLADTYLADVTSLDLVTNGSNTIPVSGLDYGLRTAGLSLTVIVDDGGRKSTFDIRDGIDVDFHKYEDSRGEMTPVVFDFPSATAPRTAGLHLDVGSIEEGRPHLLHIAIGDAAPVTIQSPFGSTDGSDWDTMTFDLDIPAGVTQVVVEIESAPDESDDLPASILWAAASLALGPAGPPPCTVPDPSLAESSANAFVLDLDIPGLGVDETYDATSAAASGTESRGHTISPRTVSIQRPDKPGSILAQFDLVASGSLAGNTADTADGRGYVEIANLRIFGDPALAVPFVTADAIVVNATAHANGLGADASTFESRIEGLAVSGLPVQLPDVDQAIVPNESLVIPGVGTLDILATSTSESEGVSLNEAEADVVALRLTLDLGLPAPLDVLDGAVIQIAGAAAAAEFQASNCPKPAAEVSGFGHVLLAEVSSVLGSPVTTDFVSVGPIPASGGDETAILFGGSVPDVVSAGTAYSQTHGGIAGALATGQTVTGVQGLDVLDGAGTATAVKSWAEVVNDNGTTAVSAGTTILDAVVLGLDVCATVVGYVPGEVCTPPPNFVALSTPQFIGGIVVFSVVLNEQISENPLSTGPQGCANGDEECTVNAIHIRGASLLTGLGIDLIVAQSHGDAHVIPVP